MKLPPSRPTSEVSELVEVPEVATPAVTQPTGNITLTMEQFQALLASVGSNNSGPGLADAIAALTANAPRRRKTIGEYDPRTYVQPDKSKALKLTRDCYQNGTPMYAENINNEEISLLNRITHSGRYINRVVEVVVASNGTVEEVYLRYNNRTNDQRNNNSRLWNSLTNMLTQIVEAQEAEDKEAAETKEAMAELRRRGQKLAGV